MNKLISFWSAQSISRRSNLLIAWTHTLALIAILFLIGGNLLCDKFNLPDLVRLIFVVVGGISLSSAVILNIWGDVIVYWNKD